MELKQEATNVNGVAKMLGVSYPLALELTEREGFPCIRIGRRKVIPVDAFKRWLDAQTCNSSTIAEVMR
jgi:hypothetical protein